jgi:hypothetical protein
MRLKVEKRFRVRWSKKTGFWYRVKSKKPKSPKKPVSAKDCKKAFCTMDICPDGNGRAPFGDNCCSCERAPIKSWTPKPFLLDLTKPPKETVMVYAGQTIEVTKAGNPTTGYQWKEINSCAAKNGGIEVVKKEFKAPDTKMDGAGGVYHWTFKANDKLPSKC